MAADLRQFRVNFFFDIVKIVYCVYSLESPRPGDSNNTNIHSY